MMTAIQQSNGGLLAIQDLLELIEQFGEGLRHYVGSGGVVLGQVVGRLPLLDHVVSGGVVG